MFFGFAFLALASATVPSGNALSANKACVEIDTKFRVFGTSWREVRVEDAGGVTDDSSKLLCFYYSADTVQCWVRYGELTEGSQAGSRVVVRADATPMQIDFVYVNQGKEYATPSIFRFDAKKLVVAEPTAPSAVAFRKDGIYPNRPTGFAVDKVNKYLLRTLVPCDYLAQD